LCFLIRQFGFGTLYQLTALRVPHAEPFASRLNTERPIEMTKNRPSETAKIYDFPAGGRRSLPNSQHGVLPDAHEPHPALTWAECGSGWYHDAAVQEPAKPEPARKH
jgi:hypothetical protein